MHLYIISRPLSQNYINWSINYMYEFKNTKEYRIN